MANRKPLAETDFSRALNHFEPYRQARKKLDDLISEHTEMEKKLAEIAEQLSEATLHRAAERRLLSGTPEEQMPGDLQDAGARLEREIRVVAMAIRLQRDAVDDARRKASARYETMIEEQWIEEVVTPIIKALEALAAAIAREKDIRERMRDTGIDASSLPATAIPLGDPREPSSLFNLKLEEIREDYDLDA